MRDSCGPHCTFAPWLMLLQIQVIISIRALPFDRLAIAPQKRRICLMRFVGNPKPPLILPSIFRPRIFIIESRLKRQPRYSVSCAPLYRRPRRYCHRGNQFSLKNMGVVIDSSANPRYRGCKWRFLRTPVLSSASSSSLSLSLSLLLAIYLSISLCLSLFSLSQRDVLVSPFTSLTPHLIYFWGFGEIYARRLCRPR